MSRVSGRPVDPALLDAFCSYGRTGSLRRALPLHPGSDQARDAGIEMRHQRRPARAERVRLIAAQLVDRDALHVFGIGDWYAITVYLAQGYGIAELGAGAMVALIGARPSDKRVIDAPAISLYGESEGRVPAGVIHLRQFAVVLEADHRARRCIDHLRPVDPVRPPRMRRSCDQGEGRGSK